MKNRNKTLDVLRGIAIILVIVGHLRHMIPEDALINRIIYSFHMPLFLIVSGYLFGAKSEKDESSNVISMDYIRRKYDSIVKPYFVFSFLSLLCTMPNSVFSVRDMIGGIFLGGGSTASRVENVALWFLPMFFISTVVFAGLYSICLFVAKKFSLVKIKEWLLVFLVGIVTICGYFLLRRTQATSGYAFWSYDIALFVQAFFLIGYFFHRLETRMKKKTVSFIVLIISGIAWVALIRLNGRVDLNGRNIGNVVLYYAAGAFGTVFWYMLSKCLISRIPVVSGLLAWCGKNSLLIMGTHLPLAMVFYSGLSEFLPFKAFVWDPGPAGVVYIVSYVLLFAAIIKNTFRFSK